MQFGIKIYEKMLIFSFIVDFMTLPNTASVS